MRVPLFACLIVCLVAAGCGATTRFAARGQVVDVTERDFAIKATPRQVSAGSVLFQARNRGPDAHELIVVREHGEGLRFRSDGMTISEEALKSSIVGTLEPGDAGSVRELRVHLVPGRYVLLCNMSGHYMGGMHTVVVAK